MKNMFTECSSLEKIINSHYTIHIFRGYTERQQKVRYYPLTKDFSILTFIFLAFRMKIRFIIFNKYAIYVIVQESS